MFHGSLGVLNGLPELPQLYWHEDIDSCMALVNWGIFSSRSEYATSSCAPFKAQTQILNFSVDLLV